MCLVSFIAVVLYCFMDLYAEKKIPNRHPEPQGQFNFREIRYFDRRFWVISLLCVVYYSGVTPFVAICSDFIKSKFGYSTETAGYIASISVLTAMICSPFLGKMLDVLGRRPLFSKLI